MYFKNLSRCGFTAKCNCCPLPRMDRTTSSGNEEYIRNDVYLKKLSRCGFTESRTCSLLQRMDITNGQQKVMNILGIIRILKISLGVVLLQNVTAVPCREWTEQQAAEMRNILGMMCI